MAVGPLGRRHLVEPHRAFVDFLLHLRASCGIGPRASPTSARSLPRGVGGESPPAWPWPFAAPEWPPPAFRRRRRSASFSLVSASFIRCRAASRRLRAGACAAGLAVARRRLRRHHPALPPSSFRPLPSSAFPFSCPSPFCLFILPHVLGQLRPSCRPLFPARRPVAWDRRRRRCGPGCPSAA